MIARSQRVLRRWPLPAFALAWALGSLRASDPSAGEGAASYLRLGIGARALGMGGAQVAVAEGPEALYWNPALLVNSAPGELAAGTARLGEDRDYSYALAGGRFRLGGPRESAEWSIESQGEGRDWPVFRRPEEGRRIGLAAGIVSAGQAGFEGRDDFGIPTGGFDDRGSAFMAGLGADLFEDLWLGIGVDYLTQDLGDAKADGLGFGLGLAWESPGRSWRLAASGRSIGSSLAWEQRDPVTGQEIEYDEDVPMLLAGGGAFLSSNGRFIGTAEAALTEGDSVGVRAGLEWRPQRALALRAGLDRGDPSAGIGLRLPLGWTEARLDYAYQYDTDGVTTPHWLTMALAFGSRRAPVSTDHASDAGSEAPEEEPVVLAPTPPLKKAPPSATPRSAPASNAGPAPSSGGSTPAPRRHRIPK